MRITFILSTVDFSGGIRTVAAYADRLKKRGHDVLIVSTPHPKPLWKAQVKSLLCGQGWVSTPTQSPSHLDGINVPHHQLSQCRPVTNTDVPDADVVIATWWETAEWVAKLSPAKGAKAYFIQHYEVFDYLPKQRVKATWHLPMHKLVVSQWLADLAQTDYDDYNTTLVPNSVDTTHFYAPPRDKQPMPTVGMMYGSTYWKGVDIGLEAFVIAARSVPTLRLIIVGNCPWSKKHKQPVNSHYIQTPTQDHLRELYASCDVWLFMSRTEGYGLPILEAMACRTPVIGTPVGAAPELLTEGAGILVKPNNPQAMAEAIVDICRLSNQEWQHLSATAYTRAIGYTWDDATDLFEQGLNCAIASSHNPASSVNDIISRS